MKIKINQNVIFGIIILIGIIILGCLKLFDNKTEPNKKIGNNLDVDKICKIENIYDDGKVISISYCHDGKVSVNLLNNEVEYLDIKSVKGFHSYYDTNKNVTYFYMIDNSGKVYETTSKNILNSDFKVSKIKSIKNVKSVENLTIFKDDKPSYNIYAVKENNDLVLLKEIY